MNVSWCLMTKQDVEKKQGGYEEAASPVLHLAYYVLKYVFTKTSYNCKNDHTNLTAPFPSAQRS
jgi:hypothetical protein